MNRMKRLLGRKLFLSMLGISLLGSMHAQEAKDTLALTLDKALQVAMDENPVIKVSNKEIELKKVASKEAWQTLLPQVDLNGQLNHTIKAAEMNIGGQSFKMGKDNSNTVNAAVAVSLPLFAPAVYKTMSLTRTDIELAVEKSRASKLDLVNQVTKAYYQLLLTQDSYQVLKESYQVAEENYQVVSAKYSQGTVSEFDKISAEVQMRSIKPNLISAENAVTLAQLQLKVLMGITSDVALKLNDELMRYESGVFANQLTEDSEGLKNNSTIKQLELNQTLLAKNLGIVKMGFLPTLSMSLNYQYQSLNNSSLNLFNYSWGNSSAMIFNLSIPLYKAKNFTKMKSTRIQMTQLELNKIDTERKLNMQVTAYRNNMAKSSEQVVSNRETVMQAKKAVQIAGKRYDVGKGTVLELNSSQVSLTQAQLTYNQSIYDYLVAKADLDQLLGKE